MSQHEAGGVLLVFHARLYIAVRPYVSTPRQRLARQIGIQLIRFAMDGRTDGRGLIDQVGLVAVDSCLLVPPNPRNVIDSRTGR